MSIDENLSIRTDNGFLLQLYEEEIDLLSFYSPEDLALARKSELVKAKRLQLIDEVQTILESANKIVKCRRNGVNYY